MRQQKANASLAILRPFGMQAQFLVKVAPQTVIMMPNNKNASATRITPINPAMVYVSIATLLTFGTPARSTVKPAPLLAHTIKIKMNAPVLVIIHIKIQITNAFPALLLIFGIAVLWFAQPALI